MDVAPSAPARRSILGPLFGVAANLIPVAGVVWLGWDAIQLLFLFWIESFIVGAITWQRIRTAQGEGPQRFRLTGFDRPESFFVLHYGIFWLVHGVLLTVFTLLFPVLGGPRALWDGVVASPDFWLGVGAVIVTSGLGYWYGWVQPQAWRTATPGRELMRPYGRLIALHLVMTMGLGVMIASGGDSMAVILIFCVVKAVFDLIFDIATGGRREARSSR